MKRLRSYLSKQTAAYAAVIIVLAVGGWYLFGRSGSDAADTLVMAPVDFAQRVSSSGKVVAARDVDLGFSQGGRIARVYVAVGDRVSAGQVLAEVENADLRAALAQQQAKLDSLKAGAQPADIAASQAAYDKASQDLDNLYQSVGDSAASAYTSANDAVRTQLAALFNGTNSNSPQLAFSTSNSQAAIDAVSARVAASATLDAWQRELIAMPQTLTKAQAAQVLSADLSRLADLRGLLVSVSAALDSSTLTGSALTADKAAVVAAQTEINAAVKSLNTINQSVASQVATVNQMQAQLTLKQSGASKEDIAAQAAAVAQAEAQLEKTVITAPFNGIITRVDAKVGLAAAASTPQVSVESSGTFQIESYIPEVSIAQVHVGDPAQVTLDAYGPDVAFTASVVSIDPAETVRDGVSTYRVVLQFAEPDDRVKSGMTATLSITTSTRPNALVVPQGAVFQKGEQTVVQVRRGSSVIDVPVSVGESSIGDVEVLSGLMAGDEVVLSPDTAR